MTAFAYDEIRDFLFAEARFLDDRQWDEWLNCYAKSAEFWMPSWDDDNELVEDPQSEVSLMYYAQRDGLEDRVFRIRTEKSSATAPMPRTSHNIANIEITDQTNGVASVRFNWMTLSYRYKKTTTYFGASFYKIVKEDGALKIVNKKVVLKDDYIPHVIDVYHI